MQREADLHAKNHGIEVVGTLQMPRSLLIVTLSLIVVSV
jgi:hypothetical protein